MVEAQVLVQRLLTSQKQDGGWPFSKGSSWTEPTALALLALEASLSPSADQARERSLNWLLSQQRNSGGWAPHPQVDECTSVTSVCALALLSTTVKPVVLSQHLDSALAWTASQVYRDHLSLSALLSSAFGLPPAQAPGSVAWYPGTAGWVTPTSLSAITLLRASLERNKSEFQQLALSSCSYLLSRRCVDHGWNHGGSKTRSEDATSYPETTGLALLALRAARIAAPPESLSLAGRFLLSPESIEGLSWLHMALPPQIPVPDPSMLPQLRNNRDAALRLLALSARQGRNIFIEKLT